MVPKESGFNQSVAKRDVFHARLPLQGMMELYKDSIFVITETQFVIQSQVT